MNRKAFFASLSALLVTITGKLFGQTTIITPCRPKIRWGNQIPLCNGQCPNPECDYRAQPWAWVPDGAMYMKPSDDLPAFYTTISKGEGPTMDIRLLRCPNCNTAFWQDPELVFRTEPKQ